MVAVEVQRAPAPLVPALRHRTRALHGEAVPRDEAVTALSPGDVRARLAAMAPSAAAVIVWTDAGGRPGWHARATALVRQEMPLLAEALDRMAARGPSFLTVAEVARKLRVSKMTVFRAIRAGEFPGTVKAGRQLRIPTEAADRYMRRRARADHPELASGASR